MLIFEIFSSHAYFQTGAYYRASTVLKIRMILLDRFLWQIFFKVTLGIQIVQKFKSKVQMIDILLKCILWYEFLSNKIVTKKWVK